MLLYMSIKEIIKKEEIRKRWKEEGERYEKERKVGEKEKCRVS